MTLLTTKQKRFRNYLHPFSVGMCHHGDRDKKYDMKFKLVKLSNMAKKI